MREDVLSKPLARWMDGSGRESDIVLSSRVRLARNLSGVPFPSRAGAAQLEEAARQAQAALPVLAERTGRAYEFIDLSRLTPLERSVLVEKHIISAGLAADASQSGRALALSEDDRVGVMINEEDHFRIQSMASGLHLAEALALAHQVDDALEETVDVAFDERLGYLTSCPTNIGTGLRASVMVHLPGLALTRQIGKIVNAATQLGLAVRGLYGEGTEAAGNIFQISNQLTLGLSDQEIVENLTNVAAQILNHERAARRALYEREPAALADKVWRAYGIARYARSVSGGEALGLLSAVRLGVDLDIIRGVPAEKFNELLVSTQPNYLRKMNGGEALTEEEVNLKRARLIRALLEELEQDRAAAGGRKEDDLDV